jgi:hypothetical protein
MKIIIGLVLLSSNLHAQWSSETYNLKEGWNAIWLPHDASHDTIDNLFPVSVEEVWRWNPASSTTQFTTSPAAPVQPDTQWLVWKRGFPLDSTMTSVSARAACLVKVANGTPDFAMQLTGRPVPPSYEWASSGLNFFGFPMKTPNDPGAQNFETFLSYSSVLSAGPDIFKYVGGPITSNPVQVNAPLFEPVVRGSAYWIKSSDFTDYYGPLRISVSGSGLRFGETGSLLTLKLKNVSGVSLDASLTPAASATPPAGEDAIAGLVPLRIRGSLDLQTGQFTYTDFSAITSYTLAAGEEVEVIIAVDRAAMGGSPGDLFQSIVQVTDSLNVSRIDLPVSASTTPRTGLWVGSAVVTTVDQITAAPDPQPDGTSLVDVTTDADAETPAAFPVRLILHRADDGTVRLLQQVYLGKNLAGELIISTSESALDPAELSSARRLSSATFPLGEQVTKTGADLGLSGASAFSSVLSYTAATNPFLHTYHPDHDNKDAQFNPTPLPEGVESYNVARAITMSYVADPATLGLSELGWGSTVLGGNYQETVSGLRAQDITVKGVFILRRVSDVATLVGP